ncbi:MAG: DNA-directed RNA polymerase subunit alpha [Armatimonadota bacterium]|nr:DNA-directed RNA polymerase subunit alpha [Armatimonadota bacterium]MDW8024737.1 DNA-directed RNA polymerase subunit alpha [Armatimonadota bacterium]
MINQQIERMPKIRKLTGDEKYARYEVTPLDAGMGTTVGNALRRVLLNEILGAAVTFIKIDGVLHEYTTIPGVKEDVIEIILNIKDLAIKVNDTADTSRPQKASVAVRGRGEVTGADIRMPIGYEVVNPELHIAELTDEKARLSMELVIEVGKGYTPADAVDRSKLEIGLIPVDAIFAPIKRVNFAVEPTRVGTASNYERLILEVWSNGAINIDQAIVEAACLLVDHFRLFFGLGLPRPFVPVSSMGGLVPTEALLDRLIETTGLDKRVTNILIQSGIRTLGDLVSKTEEELLSIKGFRRQALMEVVKVLDSFGLKLKESEK